MKEVTLAPLAVDRYGGGVSRMQQPDSTHGVHKLLQYFAEWLPTRAEPFDATSPARAQLIVPIGATGSLERGSGRPDNLAGATLTSSGVTFEEQRLT